MKTNGNFDNSNAPNSAESALRPTYAPAGMAMGVTMLAWGILTQWIMSLAGAGLVAWALWSWINELRSEWITGDER